MSFLKNHPLIYFFLASLLFLFDYIIVLKIIIIHFLNFYFQVFKEIVEQYGQNSHPSTDYEETLEKEHIAKYIWKMI